MYYCTYSILLLLPLLLYMYVYIYITNIQQYQFDAFSDGEDGGSPNVLSFKKVI